MLQQLEEPSVAAPPPPSPTLGAEQQRTSSSSGSSASSSGGSRTQAEQSNELSSGGCSGSGGATATPLPLLAQFPAQTISAVNTVLFERHGYRASNRWGMPRDSSLSSVMETGVGCSAALSILYMEVCSRLGLPLCARPLEDGRYWLLWPERQELSAPGGQRLVLDAYGCGSVLRLEEVRLMMPCTHTQLRSAA